MLPLFFLPGFAQERQFQLNPVDDMFGNRVTLVSNTLSVPCDVERDSTHSNQIMCYTRYSSRHTLAACLYLLISQYLVIPTPTIRQNAISKYSATARLKNSLLKGKNLQQSQAQGRGSHLLQLVGDEGRELKHTRILAHFYQKFVLYASFMYA